jgi:transcriptional regulator with XRE-family HTH domain
MTMAGPTVKRLQLGIELRKLREAVGMSQQDAATAIKTSKSRLSAVETGRNVLTYPEQRMLLRDVYLAEHRVEELEVLRAEGAKRGWWGTYGLPEWLAGYVGLEHDAKKVRAFGVALIPGLLQTEAYTRASFAVDERWTSEKEIGKRIAARMHRQKRLTDPDSLLELSAVVSEEALVRCVHHPLVATDQLRLLTERAELPNVELRILPFTAALHVGMSGPFSLLSFPDRLLPDVAYQEYPVGGHLIDDENTVSQLDKLFDKLHGLTLGANESQAKIVELARNI